MSQASIILVSICGHIGSAQRQDYLLNLLFVVVIAEMLAGHLELSSPY